MGTGNSTVDQQSALAHLDQKPVYNGSGRSLTVPLEITPSQGGGCTVSGEIGNTGVCPNNDANFGSVTGTIGGSRAITMGLHITY